MCMHTYISISVNKDMYMLAYAQTSSKCNQKDTCTVTDFSISGTTVTSQWVTGRLESQGKGYLLFTVNVFSAICIFYHMHVYIFLYKNLF